MDNLAKWLIMAYLDGNNELEPEMAAAKSDMENANLCEDVEVLLEIGLLDKETVGILRPDGKPSAETWSGVRRYHLCRAGCRIVENMGKRNMSDPSCLYEFIKWGMQNYKAEHYMLILGGHSCEYIGMMNDYSQDKPYIMGIPEISLVLEYVKNTVGRQIDLLIFDTCLFNNIELLYELGYYGTPAVKTIITYRENAPAVGLSYCELLETVARNCKERDIVTFIKMLVASSSEDLIAFKIEPSDLEKIKRLYSALARGYLADISSRDPNIHPDIASLMENTENNPQHETLSEIAAYESSLIVCGKSTHAIGVEKLGALGKYIPDIGTAALYYRLAFARNNEWTKLICSKLQVSSFRLAISIGFTPMILPMGKITALIISSNPNHTSDAADGILKRLSACKKWDIQGQILRQ